MNSLVKIKSLITAFLFLSFTSSSYAVENKSYVIENDSYGVCKEQFTPENFFLSDVLDKSIDSEPINNLIIRFDYALEEQKLWLRQNPSLLRELYEYFRALNSRLKQKVSLSESLHIQQELDNLVLPWVFGDQTMTQQARSFLLL